MGRILKLLGIVVGAVVILVVAVLVAVVMLVDPNDYKDQITAAVDEATGRTLTLEGDLELKLFPRIGIALGAAELSNAAGFGDEPFARIAGAELRVGLLPLLSRRVEVERAMLSGLRLNLARNGAGVTNWDDLARSGDGTGAAAAAPAEDEGAGGSVDISVGAITIADAEVSWRDATTGQDWRLSDFNLEASDFDPGHAFPLEIGFELAGADMTVRVHSEMRAQVSLAESTYRLNDLNVDLEGSGAGWPGGDGEVSLSFEQLVANLDDQSLDLDGLELEMLGLTVSGNLTGANLLDNLSLDGGIEIADFDPRDLMSAFDTTIETADPDVLEHASASADFYFNSQGMGMRDMTLRLDDSALTGSAGLNGERVEFDLTVDAIDIDRYLPPAADEDSANPDEGSVDEVDLPLEALRDFNARGNLKLDRAQFLGLMFDEANFALTAGNGRMTLSPTGRLYGGTLDSAIGVALQGDAARMTLRADLTDVDMAGVARDYLKMDTLEGTGNVKLDLAATGSKVGQIKQDLDGTASVAITDGAWLGIDIWHTLMSARAKITGPEVAPLEGAPRTTFQRVAISGNVEDAVLQTTEFSGSLPFAALTGSGTINLLTMALDIRANARLIDGPTLQQDPVFSKATSLQFPVRISGTLDAPSVLPDLSAVGGLLSQAVRGRAQEEVNAAVDEQRDEVNQQLEEARDEARENVRESLRDRLRGLRDN